jgi:dihydroorotate dehydrogenase (fumarate)
MGVELNNPIIAGSSKLTSELESIQRISDYGAGAIILKSIYEEQIRLETNNSKDLDNIPADFTDYIQYYSSKLPLSDYLKLIENAKHNIKIPVFASVNCVKTGNWIEFLKDIESAGADGIELNIFFFPDDKDFRAEDYEKIYFELVLKATHQLQIPVAIKIPPLFTNPLNAIDRLFYRGASGIVMFNNHYQPDIDIQEMEIITRRQNELSYNFYNTLRWIGLASSHIKNMNIAASCEVSSSDDIIKLLLIGANAVMISDLLYKKGIDYLNVILNEITEWMDSKGFTKIEQFQGQMNYGQLINTFYFEREQLMRTDNGEGLNG